MKIRSMFLILSLLLISALLAACGGGDAPPAESTQAAGAVPTEGPPTGPMEVLVSDIQNTTWQWVELVENNPAAQSVVPDPQNYTLALFDDGTYSVTADCKSGMGNYTVNGSQITLEPFPVTMQICSEDSLEPQFLSLLGQVGSFGMADGRLVLVLLNEAGEMRFQDGGVAEKPSTPVEKTLYVGPEKVPCEGEGPMECYQVKETPDGEWQLFYNEIEGFEWELGYIYELRVNVYQVENPPAGGSSLRYELIEVVSKTPV
jgi:heat shock protein HslJ